MQKKCYMYCSSVIHSVLSKIHQNFFFYRLNLASILSDEHKVSNEIPKVANEVLPEVRKSKY